MQAHESTAISTAPHPPKVWEQFVDDVYSIVKRTHLENFFHHINNLHQNIKFTMEEESNGELASSVKWGLLTRNEVGLFQIFDHVKTIKKPLKLPFYKKHHFLR